MIICLVIIFHLVYKNTIIENKKILLLHYIKEKIIKEPLPRQLHGRELLEIVYMKRKCIIIIIQ